MAIYFCIYITVVFNVLCDKLVPLLTAINSFLVTNQDPEINIITHRSGKSWS